MAILSGREKPLANDGRAGHLRGANSAADLFDKLPPRRAGKGRLRRAARAHGFLQVERRIAKAFGTTATQLMPRKRLTIHAGKRSSSPPQPTNRTGQLQSALAMCGSEIAQCRKGRCGA